MPENLLVDADVYVKITNFGFSKDLDAVWYTRVFES
jgi:serine/threonine protein kinase